MNDSEVLLCVVFLLADGVKFVRVAFACRVAQNLIENNYRGVNDRFHFLGVLLGGIEWQHPEQDDFPQL